MIDLSRDEGDEKSATREVIADSGDAMLAMGMNDRLIKLLYTLLPVVSFRSEEKLMEPISKIVPRLELEDPRRATETAHSTIRELIYSGDLPAGLIISQVELAEALGVSRTPLREAMRMLQEEGLIEGEPNRRARVAGFDAHDVDASCGARIMLESLGMTITLKEGVEDLLQVAAAALEAMESDEHAGVSATWHEAHRRFHRAFTSRAPSALREQLDSGTERAERYVRQLAQGVLTGWTHGREDHRRIFALVAERRVDEAIYATCHHYARTAVTLLADVSPEFEPAVTRSAMKMITRGFDVSNKKTI